MSPLSRIALLALSVALPSAGLSPAVAEGARQSPAFERAVKIETAVKLCRLFSTIPRSSPKFNEIAARAIALYGKAAIELDMPVPEAIRLSESRAAAWAEQLRAADQTADFCRTMKKEEE